MRRQPSYVCGKNTNIWRWIIKPKVTVERIAGRGVSSPEIRNWVVPYIVNEIQPETIFDLGMGIGVYGQCIHALKEDITMIGLDGFLAYLLQEYPMKQYLIKIHAPIEAVIDGLIPPMGDLTICMDVIEHFEKSLALKLLKIPGRMIVSTPLFDYKQEGVGGNPYEQHKCWFTEKELNEAGYKTLHLAPHKAQDGQEGMMGAFEK